METVFKRKVCGMCLLGEHPILSYSASYFKAHRIHVEPSLLSGSMVLIREDVGFTLHLHALLIVGVSGGFQRSETAQKVLFAVVVLGRVEAVVTSVRHLTHLGVPEKNEEVSEEVT